MDERLPPKNLGNDDLPPAFSPHTHLRHKEYFRMSTETPIVEIAKKRKVKDLPPGLDQLTETCDFWKSLKFRLETDGKEPGEHMVAYEACFDGDDDNDFPSILLEKLTLDQLRKLCRNVGCHYVHKCNKFHCRKALWVLANHHQQREKDGAPMSIESDRTSSNIIRMTNVMFSNVFVDDLVALNDIKKRNDHETPGSLPKDFWANVAESFNSLEEDDDTALKVVMSEADPHYEEVLDLVLEDFDMMTDVVIRKKFNQLMKVRREVQANMTTSGEHDSDAYNFMDIAMKNVKSSGLTKIGCYYFFVRCDAKPEIDVRFNDRMEASLMGNTDTPLSDLSVGTGANFSNERKRAYAAISDMSSVVVVIAEEMKTTNRLAEKSAVAIEASNELKKQKNLIAMAQHLGKNEFLEQYFANLSSGGD
jgi:hypothetical protein